MNSIDVVCAVIVAVKAMAMAIIRRILFIVLMSYVVINTLQK